MSLETKKQYILSFVYVIISIFPIPLCINLWTRSLFSEPIIPSWDFKKLSHSQKIHLCRKFISWWNWKNAFGGLHCRIFNATKSRNDHSQSRLWAKNKGFRWVTKDDMAETSGDEPLLYANRFENVPVAVCEKRKEGVIAIQKQIPNNEVIVLDDAFQHRAVQAGISVLVTDYNQLFSRDFLLPVGKLREGKSGSSRADAIVVSKCPESLSESEKEAISKELKFDQKNVFFSQIAYAKPVHFGTEIQSIENYVLVTGIANPAPLLVHLGNENCRAHFKFPDHYAFTAHDIQQIHQKFDTFADGKTILLTTEKDFMRLKPHLSEWKLHSYPWYFQPISVVIDREIEFKNLITSYVGKI